MSFLKCLLLLPMISAFSVYTSFQLPSNTSPCRFPTELSSSVASPTDFIPERQQKTTVKTGHNLPPNVRTVETLEEFKIAITDESSKVVVVRFYATWCRMCKAIEPMYYRVANKFSNVVFLDVPVIKGKNEDLFKELGVNTFPFAHIYFPTEGLMEEMKLTRGQIPIMIQKLQCFITASSKFHGVGNPTSIYLEECSL